MPTVKTNGIDTYYERRGNGPPVVFVHGAVLDHNQWDPQLDRLGDAYTTVAYDVRGHGHTGGSAEPTYSMALLAADLDALVRALDLDRPVICGLSTGGAIAQVYAATYPDRLSGLVLADTFAPEILTWSEWLQRSLMLRATVPLVRLVGYERVERWMVRLQERLQGSEVSGDYEQIERLREDSPTMATAEFAKVIRAVARFHEERVDFSAITVPTLVLYGEHEPAFIRRHAPKLGTAISDAVVRKVPDAGHASNLDNPDFFTEVLRDFLADVSPRTGSVDDAGLT